MTVLERIKYLAEKRGKTLRQVTDDLKFSENYLYTLKTKTPNGQTLEKLADYFNVTVDYILGRDFKPDFVVDDIPVKMKVKRTFSFDADVEKGEGIFYNIELNFENELNNSSLLYDFNKVKNIVEKKLHDDFYGDAQLSLGFTAEQLFISELIKLGHTVSIEESVKAKKTPLDLAELVDESKVDWDEWVSFDGKPLTDEVKSAMKLILGKRLED